MRGLAVFALLGPEMSKHPRIIGVHGKKYHGKDTIGKYLVSNHDYHQLSFAKPMKLAAMNLLGMTMEQLEDPVLKEKVDPRWGFHHDGFYRH